MNLPTRPPTTTNTTGNHLPPPTEQGTQPTSATNLPKNRARKQQRRRQPTATNRPNQSATRQPNKPRRTGLVARHERRTGGLRLQRAPPLRVCPCLRGPCKQAAGAASLSQEGTGETPSQPDPRPTHTADCTSTHACRGGGSHNGYSSSPTRAPPSKEARKGPGDRAAWCRPGYKSH